MIAASRSSASSRTSSTLPTSSRCSSARRGSRPAQLSHPNVVHIYDFGKVDGRLLSSRWSSSTASTPASCSGSASVGNPRPERLPPTLVARIGADASAALHYAHELRGPNVGTCSASSTATCRRRTSWCRSTAWSSCATSASAKAAALSDQLNATRARSRASTRTCPRSRPSPRRSTAVATCSRSPRSCCGSCSPARPSSAAATAVEAMRAIRDGKLLSKLEKAAPDTAAPAWSIALQVAPCSRPAATSAPPRPISAQALEGFIKSAPEPRDADAARELAQAAHPPRGHQGRLAGDGRRTARHRPPAPAPSRSPEPRARRRSRARAPRAARLIAASRITPPAGGEDDAETISMGPPRSEIRAAIAARRAPAATPQRRRPPNIIVERGMRAQDAARDPRGTSTVTTSRDGRPPGQLDDNDLGDTAYDPPGEGDRTLRRAREDIDAEHDQDSGDDSGEDDIVDSSSSDAGSKLREVMANRARPRRWDPAGRPRDVRRPPQCGPRTADLRDRRPDRRRSQRTASRRRRAGLGRAARRGARRPDRARADAGPRAVSRRALPLSRHDLPRSGRPGAPTWPPCRSRRRHRRIARRRSSSRPPPSARVWWRWPHPRASARASIRGCRRRRSR